MPPEPERLAERAWRQFASSLRPPIDIEIADDVEAFLEAKPRKNAEGAAAVLMIMLAYLPSGDPPWFDAWSAMGMLTTEVYMKYDGEGFGNASALSLLDAFFRFKHERGDIDAVTLSDVLDQIDEQRTPVGVPRKRHPSGQFLSAAHLDSELARYARELSVKEANIAAVGAHGAYIVVDRVGRRGRLDALTAAGVAELFLEAGEGDPSLGPFHAACVSHLIGVLEHLGDRAIRDDVCEALCVDLRRLAAGFAASPIAPAA